MIKHQRTMGGKLSDFLMSMDLTKDGGLIAGGYSYSNISGEKTENSKNGDYWIIKLDNLGKIQWDKTIGGDDFDLLYSLQQTSDGGYILGGNSRSNISGEKTENSKGLDDYWVVKLDSMGNVQWDKTIGGSGTDDLTSLQQISDGGYILGGYSYSGKSGDKTENNRGAIYSSDYWVVKLDSLGNIQWDKTIGGSLGDRLSALQQTTDGGYILGGYSYSNRSGEKTENNRCGCANNPEKNDYWLVKLNSSGQIEWDKTIGGSNDEKFYDKSLVQTTDGGFILGGFSNSNISGEKTQNSRGDDDYWIVKLDGVGNMQWDKTIGGSDFDALSSLQQTSDGGYILGGPSSSNISGEKTENNKGGYDYWVVKLDNLGKIQWDKTIGGNLSDELSNIKEIGKYHYVLGGFSYSGKSADKTQWNRGYIDAPDYWLVELVYRKSGSLEITSDQDAYSLKAPATNNKSFLIYPNPVKDILHIQTNGKAIFTLTNQSGKILLTKTINNKGEINVANLAAGLYYLKNSATGVVQKVIISR